MSYLSKDSSVQAVQLKVQEVCVKTGDAILEISDSSLAVIDLGEDIDHVRAVLFSDVSTGSVHSLASTISNDQEVNVEAPVAIAASDAIIVKYVIAE